MAEYEKCPFCGRSLWMGESPEGCQCAGTVTHLEFSFVGDNVRPGPLSDYGLRVGMEISKRRHLYHLIGGLEFHLKCAREQLQRMDAELKDKQLHPNGRCTCAGEGMCEWCRLRPIGSGG